MKTIRSESTDKNESPTQTTATQSDPLKAVETRTHSTVSGDTRTELPKKSMHDERDKEVNERSEEKKRHRERECSSRRLSVRCPISDKHCRVEERKHRKLQHADQPESRRSPTVRGHKRYTGSVPRRDHERMSSISPAPSNELRSRHRERHRHSRERRFHSHDKENQRNDTRTLGRKRKRSHSPNSPHQGDLREKLQRITKRSRRNSSPRVARSTSPALCTRPLSPSLDPNSRPLTPSCDEELVEGDLLELEFDDPLLDVSSVDLSPPPTPTMWSEEDLERVDEYSDGVFDREEQVCTDSEPHHCSGSDSEVNTCHRECTEGIKLCTTTSNTATRSGEKVLYDGTERELKEFVKDGETQIDSEAKDTQPAANNIADHHRSRGNPPVDEMSGSTEQAPEVLEEGDSQEMLAENETYDPILEEAQIEADGTAAVEEDLEDGEIEDSESEPETVEQEPPCSGITGKRSAIEVSREARARRERALKVSQSHNTHTQSPPKEHKPSYPHSRESSTHVSRRSVDCDRRSSRYRQEHKRKESNRH